MPGLSGTMRAQSAQLIFRLRPEEFLALLFLAPTTYLTLVAQRYALGAGVLGDRYPGGVLRLGVAILLIAALAAAVRLWPQSRMTRTARELLPFVVCVLIYTNLHDTIGFVNPHDVHHHLIAIDQALFGIQPSIWAERFVSRGLTELMAFFYAGFVWIAPAVPFVLAVRGRHRELRSAMLGVIVCFYLGYFLYVAFPAAPPRLVLALEYRHNLAGYPNRLYQMTQYAFDLLPVDSRAAFPSLHAAVSLLSLYYAWRYARVLCWVMLPFVIGLWVSTIYLRHHYAVDLLVGWTLAPVAIMLAPALDAWWTRRQNALGFPSALGTATATSTTGMTPRALTSPSAKE
jgi:membrane-associated phospholipid phosphatase